MCGDVKLSYRYTVTADILCIKEKARLVNLLYFVTGRMSLTSYLLTSIVTDGYLCLTAHSFIVIGLFREKF